MQVDKFLIILTFCNHSDSACFIEQSPKQTYIREATSPEVTNTFVSAQILTIYCQALTSDWIMCSKYGLTSNLIMYSVSCPCL